MPLVPPVSADDPHVARRAVAWLLSRIVPGAGQAFAGAWRRGLILFVLFAFGAVPVLVVAAVPVLAAAWLLEGRLLPAALGVNIFLLALRLFAALDAWRMGLPAKSGVAGGLVAVSPGQFGIGLFSPLLDAQGNSVSGVRACELRN